MSAGIILMNKTAVAMAADSAVTIGNHSAIHNSANKLFSLSKYAPVGAIIYASASLMQIPFEVIIKEYKKQLKEKTFDTLEEYKEDFINYLQNSSSLFRFDKNERYYVIEVCANLLSGMENDYRNKLEKEVNNVKRELKKTELHKVQKDTLKQTLDYVKELNTLGSNFSSYVKKTYYSDIEKCIKGKFAWLGKGDTKQLAKAVCSVYDLDFFRNGYVGIAIAGYGNVEIFPQVSHLHLSGVINGKVRYQIIDKRSITETNFASILPLAQTDVMQTFLFGINDSLIGKMADEITSQIEEKIKTIPDVAFVSGKKDDLLKTLNDATPKIVEKIVKSANDNYMKPILYSVASLPIEELTSFAESLISITSTRRQVALDGNIGTVGGPIDVAVISKGDGFIWLKRKHYFDAKDNPHYLINYYGNRLIEGVIDNENK